MRLAAAEANASRRRRAVRLVRVVVGAAGDGDPEPRRHGEVARGRARIVSRVVRLERVEAGGDEAPNPFVVADEAWMRQRRDAARLVNALDDFFGRRAPPRDERRPAARKPALERLVGGLDVSARDQRARDPRPPGRYPRIVDRRLQNGVGVEPDAEAGELVDHLPHAIDALAALLGEKRLQRRRRGVDEVAEHVDVGRVADRRDLDARHELDAGGAHAAAAASPAGDRVVVGDAQHGDAGRRRARDELGRRAAAVGRGGVGVEIDHRADLRARAPRCRRRGGARLALAQRAILADQQIEVRALFVGELEEDLLAFGVLEALAVALEELVRAALALDADEQRLLIVDALAQLLRRPRRTGRWPRP